MIHKKMQIIQSPQNPLIKELNLIKKGKKGKSKFLLEGLSLIQTAGKSPMLTLNHVLVTEEFMANKKEIINNFKYNEIFTVSHEIIIKLSDSVSPQGIIASATYMIPSIDEIVLSNPPLILLLDGINDPGNLGTIIRTAEAFRADAIFILPNNCHIFSPKVIRATAGSLFHIPIIHCDYNELSEYLKKHNIFLIITDPHSGKESWNVDFNRPIAIALGNEAKGVSGFIKGLKHEKVSIFTKGMAESLNVAMAGSIIFYEAFRQKNKIDPLK